jgi:protein-L-isoaspartate(D-aspartate) O-methyltransferase
MNFDIARHNMVESQIRPNRVTDDRIIAAMDRLPREAFVPAKLQGVAYVDEAVPLGGERYLMEPMVLARLIQSASPGDSDLALVIGCGSGYGAAVLSYTVSTVVAVESDPELARNAVETLAGLGIDTVTVIEADLRKGCPDQGPYDVIFFDGSVAEIPDAVSRQLAEGGRMVSVVTGDGPDPGPGPGLGKAMLMTRHAGVLSSLESFDAGTPALPGFGRQKTFVF